MNEWMAAPNRKSLCTCAVWPFLSDTPTPHSANCAATECNELFWLLQIVVKKKIQFVKFNSFHFISIQTIVDKTCFSSNKICEKENELRNFLALKSWKVFKFNSYSQTPIVLTTKFHQKPIIVCLFVFVMFGKFRVFVWRRARQTVVLGKTDWFAPSSG